MLAPLADNAECPRLRLSPAWTMLVALVVVSVLSSGDGSL